MSNPTPAPFSQEAEEAVIGSILLDAESFYPVSEHIKADDFYITRLKWVYQACQDLTRQNTPIDYLSVANILEARKQLEEAGGRPFLTYLMNSAPSAVNASFYAQIVGRASKRRQLMIIADQIKALALDESQDVESIMTQSTVLVNSLDADDRGLQHIADNIGEHMWARLSPTKHTGVESSIPDLQRLIRGYRAKRLYIIGGRPGMGKSSLMHTELIHACRHGARVALFTLENNIDDIYDELASQLTRIPFETIQDGLMNDKQKSAYTTAIDEISRWALWIDDNPHQTIESIGNKLKRMSSQHGIDVAYIDYLGLLKGGDARRFNARYLEIGHMTAEAKVLTKKLNIPLVVGAQLNRDASGKRPTLADLRESGSIEQDADVVIFIHSEDEGESEIRDSELIVAKNRNGKRGFMNVGFKGACKRFVPMMRGER